LIELVRGDIAQVEADAIVNAANDHLWMGAGVAGAIKRAGGDEIEREAMAKGPIAVGDAVATGAGRLPAKWVIHAAAMGQDLRTDAGKIRRATTSALRVADEVGARSVAFPALGTGVGGFSVDECARIMITAVRDHLAKGSRIERVIFALRGDDAYRAFEGRLR
jgi:O-acetyl-ADP-ribose deacetylase (regulator of RNase III)